MSRQYPRKQYGPFRPYERAVTRVRRDRERRLARRDAIQRNVVSDSYQLYGRTYANGQMLKANASYNVKFRFFGQGVNGQATVDDTGTEAFAQIILTPGRTDLFTNLTTGIRVYDRFMVTSIDWVFIPPATNALYGQPDFEGDEVTWEAIFANNVLRFVYDPTPNIRNLSDIRRDMKRYLDPLQNDHPQEMAKATLRKPQAFTRPSMEEQKGHINSPVATTYNEQSLLTSRSNAMIETSTTWIMTGGPPQNQPEQGDQGVGQVGVTYGTLSLVIPRFVNGAPNRPGTEREWPEMLGFLNVTYHVLCVGQ